MLNFFDRLTCHFTEKIVCFLLAGFIAPDGFLYLVAAPGSEPRGFRGDALAVVGLNLPAFEENLPLLLPDLNEDMEKPLGDLYLVMLA